MGIKIVFTDGRLGSVRYNHLDKWLRLGIIAAYKPWGKWIEVRRKSNSEYEGPEKRSNQLEENAELD